MPARLSQTRHDSCGATFRIGRALVAIGSLMALSPASIVALPPTGPGQSRTEPAADFPVATDFMVTADVNADGYPDRIAAARGGRDLYVRDGSDDGTLLVRPIGLSGAITALIAADVNRRDGLADVIVGVTDGASAQTLVFEGPRGALHAEPERIALPAAALALAVGQLDDEYPMDLVAATPAGLVIVHGRDRKLSLDPERQRSARPAVIEYVPASFDVANLRIAIAAHGARHQVEIAVIDAGGTRRFERRGHHWIEARAPRRGANPSAPRSSGAISQLAAVFTVTTTIDSGPGSLRQAILDANALPGLDTIAFDIPGPGVHTIQPATALPAVTDPVVIDGASQPGVIESPLIEVNGAFVINAPGLSITGGGTTVMRLIVNGFSGGAGIHLQTNGGNAIRGCFIGTDAFGTTAVPNKFGIFVESADNAIGGPSSSDRNVISGQTDLAVLIQNSDTNVIQGNLIGTDVTGTAAIPNAGGVAVEFGENNTVGGTTPSAGNVISGNASSAIVVVGPASGTLIQGNLIGTDITGAVALANNGFGISFTTVHAGTIGGTTPAALNVISGNGNGIEIGAGASDNLVQGNRIGVDLGGTIALPNSAGVLLVNATFNTIGGVGGGNVISGNIGNGVTIVVGGSFNTLLANLIGTNAAGTAALPNGNDGVKIDGTQFNAVGAASLGNVISGNGASGVHVVNAGVNSIRGNRIGTDVTGTFAIKNVQSGVDIEESFGIVVGGTTADGNVISGHTYGQGFAGGFGVYIHGHQSGGNAVSGNLIGTDVTGTKALGNALGVLVNNVAQNSNTIGGSTPAEGNIISGNTDKGVSADDGQTLIRRNYIGPDIYGTSALGNRIGVDIISSQSAPASVVDNVISGNLETEIYLHGAHATIASNMIGTDPTGTFVVSAPGGGGTVEKIGIDVYDGHDNQIGGNGQGNVISGHLYGVRISVPANKIPDQKHRFIGNKIGTDVTGTVPLGNFIGIWIDRAYGNIIGTPGAGFGNIITGNDTGIWISTPRAVRNKIQNNSIGLGPNNEPIGNSQSGIVIDWAAENLIGGSSREGAGNLISANGDHGIEIQGGQAVLNRIQGNWIGTDSHAVPLGNRLVGVVLRDGASRNFIGEDPATGNTIAFNAAGVVVLKGSTRNAIVQNSIHSNTLLGIDLDPIGVTANDAFDADVGPNQLQNFPTINSATVANGLTTIIGALVSVPSATYLIEFFASPSCDPSGYGEGRDVLGGMHVTTTAQGIATFTKTVGALTPGFSVTATATDANGNTSEFSKCMTVAAR